MGSFQTHDRKEVIYTKPTTSMKHKHLYWSSLRWLMVLAAALTLSQTRAAETLLQEGFNDDGTTSGRYTMTGRDVYEVPRIQSELANYDQKGPLYWDHNFKASFVGNPNIPG